MTETVSHGYAYCDPNGYPFPETVGPTERSAKVNALVTHMHVAVYQFTSDKQIAECFEARCPTGCSVRKVEIRVVR